MAVNRDKPDRWKQDIAQSVDMYNDWFMRFAPEAYRTTRVQTTKDVEATLRATKNLTDVGVVLLKAKPAVLPSLRMSTCPPLAVDRLIGLAGVSANLVNTMEKDHRLPPQCPTEAGQRSSKDREDYREDGRPGCLRLVGARERSIRARAIPGCDDRG